MQNKIIFNYIYIYHLSFILVNKYIRQYKEGSSRERRERNNTKENDGEIAF